jgi:hypothetical protein
MLACIALCTFSRLRIRLGLWGSGRFRCSGASYVEHMFNILSAYKAHPKDLPHHMDYVHYIPKPSRSYVAMLDDAIPDFDVEFHEQFDVIRIMVEYCQTVTDSLAY